MCRSEVSGGTEPRTEYTMNSDSALPTFHVGRSISVAQAQRKQTAAVGLDSPAS
jgi:hypothetical protein